MFSQVQQGSMERPVATGLVRRAAESALRYVHSCQTEDGGYYFARIPPGSLRDSYFAVKTLRLLGELPPRPADVERFVYALLHKAPGNPVHTCYLAMNIVRDMGQDLGPLRCQSELVEASLATLRGARDANALYVEVVSELERVYEAVSVLVQLGIPFDRARVVYLISSLSNRNGGFGSGGNASLPTTYYAARTSALLNCPLEQPGRTLSFLREQQRNVYFLEDLYYLSSAWCALGETFSDPEGAVSFVLDCQRSSGGFARARPMGIATLEDTYYAISLLRQVEAL